MSPDRDPSAGEPFDDINRELRMTASHMLFLDAINAASSLAIGNDGMRGTSGRNARERLGMLRDRLEWERQRMETTPTTALADLEARDFMASLIVLRLHDDIVGQTDKTDRDVLGEFTSLIDRSLQRDQAAATELDTLISYAGLRYFPDGV